MRAALHKAWTSRAPRERLVIAVAAALLAVSAYAWLVHAAGRARSQLGASVAALRTQAALLDQHAAEHARLRAAPPPAASPSDLRTLVQARAAAARLSTPTRIEALDADRVRVSFGAVSFADWLGWTAALQAQHLRVEDARIEALAAPGMVSVTATLARARRN
jgi:general secretion pathway protein M